VDFTSPRAWAYALLGITERHLATGEKGPHEAVAGTLARRLLALFGAASGADWHWCEDRLTYCNARLPQALLRAGGLLGEDAMVTTGVRALEWLVGTQTTENGLFAPVGSNGFYVRGAERAAFDQQPVEACATIAACLDAHRATGDSRWLLRAEDSFAWFLGQNQLGLSLYDAGTGGCRDGLHCDRMNENEGAESTLSFLLALLDMRASHRRTMAAGASLAEAGAEGLSGAVA
jgi:hypothetical protein